MNRNPQKAAIVNPSCRNRSPESRSPGLFAPAATPSTPKTGPVLSPMGDTFDPAQEEGR
jgi:hypothetical protein